MRIVAGAAKGRRLVAPKGDEVRPTADRVKESLFASLQPILPDARVLDLFAGTGALGLEALSRGAASVTFVEKDRRACDAIRRNIEVVDLPGTTLVAGPVERALAGDLDGAPFDLVLLDPPYHLPKASLHGVLEAVVPHLAPGGTVVVERGARDGVPTWPAALQPGEPRRYGDTSLHRAALPADGPAAPEEPAAPDDGGPTDEGAAT